MRRIFLLLVTSLIVHFCSAQRGLTVDQGAYSSSIGGISSVLLGSDAILGNFSNLADDTSSCYIISTSRRFSLSELASYSLGTHIPINKVGHIGFSVSSYGFDAYMEQNFSVHYAKRLGKSIALSSSFGYQRLTLEEYGSKGLITFALGVSGSISKSLRYGIVISNPENSAFSETTPLISEIKLGFAYKVSNKVTSYAEVEKSLEERLNFKVGLHYRIHPLLGLTAGFNTDEGQTSFGFSYQIIPKLSLDAAFQYDSLLGITPIISMKWGISQNPN